MEVRFVLLSEWCWPLFLRVWARPHHCAYPARGQFFPFQNLGGKLRRKHTKRNTVTMEEILSQVYFSVLFYWTCRSCAQPSVTHLGIKLSQWKRICTMDSFFALNESQVESEKTIQKTNSVLMRKKQMRVKGNQQNHNLSRKLGSEITLACAMKRSQCSAIFVWNLKRNKPLVSGVHV